MNTLANYFPKTFQFKPDWKPLDNEKILTYSRRAIMRITEDYDRERFMWNEYDCLSTCYCVGVKSFKEAQKLIRTFLFMELRLSYSSKNDIDRFNPLKLEHQKTCTKCKEVKPVSMFRELEDERIGFQYNSGECEECYHKYLTSEKRRKQKRDWYKNNDRAKAKAKERYLRWKERQKLNNGKTFNKNK